MRLNALKRPSRGTVLVLVGLLAAFLIFEWVNSPSGTRITVHFQNADGLYQGDDVKVLGVGVGTVTEIVPEANDVRVTLRVSGQPIPANASAAIVSPSLVSGRFVQLTPAYTGGPTMSDGASIPLARTAVPVSFDEVKQQLIELSTTLAPQNGARLPVADTIQALEQGLSHGNAQSLRSAIEGMRSAAVTLSDGRVDLFTTISNLNVFTRDLAVNDAAVTGFTTELATVSGVLAQNRQALTDAVAGLSSALSNTGTFLTKNRSTLNTSVKDLTLLSAALADRSNQLAAVLHLAPTALINLYNIIENQAITGRASLTGLSDSAQLICGAILGAGGTAQQCRDALAPLVNLIKIAQGQATVPAATGQASPGGSNVTPPGGLSNATGGLLNGLSTVLPGLLGTNLLGGL